MMDLATIAEKLESFRKFAEFGDAVRARVAKVLSGGPVPDLKLQTWMKETNQRGILVLTGALACYAALKLVVLAHHLVMEWPLLTLAPAATGQPIREYDPWSGIFDHLFHGSSLYFIEAFFLIWIVWYVNSKGYKDDDIGDSAIRRAARAENQFFQYWWPLWGTWFLLYMFLGVSSFKGWNTSKDVNVLGFHSVISDFLNNLSGVTFYGMYHVLSEDTVDDHASRSRPVWFPVLLLLIFLAVGEYSIATFNSFHFPMVLYHCGALISGLFVGTMTALFVAKLASRTIDLPQWELALLAMYAVLQAVYPALSWRDDHFGEYVGYAVVIIALYSKVVLLVVVEWARDEYRIQYYMLRARQIYVQERKSKQHDWFAYQARELYRPSIEGDGSENNDPRMQRNMAVSADPSKVVPLPPRDQKIEKGGP